MTSPSSDASQVLTHRLCWAVICLVVFTSFYILFGAFVVSVGFFWLAFIAGMFGASVNFLQRLRNSEKIDSMFAKSWMNTLMPLLYGGMLAGITYFLFMSGILSGTGASSVFSSSLFPSFTQVNAEKTGLEIRDFILSRPVTLADGGKLMVWCFLAGYSESFVTGMLGRLEKQAQGNQSNDNDSNSPN